MNKMLYRLLLAGLASAMIAGMTTPMQAATKAATTENAKAKKAKATVYNGKVATVEKMAKTFTLDGKKDLVFQVTSETRIVKDGKPATMDDVTVGESVKVRSKVKDDKTDALLVQIGKVASKAKAKKSK
jgi:uncharacterized protein YqeY